MNQGMLMESINLASAWSLPVVFVCKDNGMAVTTPSAEVTGGDLVERSAGLGAYTASVDGSDVDEVWRAAAMRSFARATAMVPRTCMRRASGPRGICSATR